MVIAAVYLIAKSNILLFWLCVEGYTSNLYGTIHSLIHTPLPVENVTEKWN